MRTGSSELERIGIMHQELPRSPAASLGGKHEAFRVQQDIKKTVDPAILVVRIGGIYTGRTEKTNTEFPYERVESKTQRSLNVSNHAGNETMV